MSSNTLYGTTVGGGAFNNGSVFKVNTDGTGFTTLHSFTDGAPGRYVGGPVLSGNTLFGNVSSGGSRNNGIIFRINTDGSGFAILHSFTNTDGIGPRGVLAIGRETLYGTLPRQMALPQSAFRL